MAGKSQVQQQVDALDRAVATLVERIDYTRKEIEALDHKQSKTADALADLRVTLSELGGELKAKVVVIDERLAELKRAVEEASRKRWAVVPAIVGALLSGLIAFLVAYFVSRR